MALIHYLKSKFFKNPVGFKNVQHFEHFGITKYREHRQKAWVETMDIGKVGHQFYDKLIMAYGPITFIQEGQCCIDLLAIKEIKFEKTTYTTEMKILFGFIKRDLYTGEKKAYTVDMTFNVYAPLEIDLNRFSPIGFSAHRFIDDNSLCLVYRFSGKQFINDREELFVDAILKFIHRYLKMKMTEFE